MKQILLKEKYPVFTINILKSETTYKNIDEIFTYLKSKIDNHPVAIYITIFDHMAHTKSLANNVIADGIIDAKNLIFCFGKEIPVSQILAVRPRSIGICEFEDSFDISLLEVPSETLHKVTEEWIKSIKNN
ncbi:MAG: hypothetical protein PHF17_05945 [Arcobacteraceae bacterium]|nr:hypothetical protein [Arcobacteraceae bacterium]